MIKMLVQQTMTQDAIFKKVNTHLYEKYGIYFANRASNWYQDLGLSDFQWMESRESLEKEFNITIPFFYFENIGGLCNVIYAEIRKQNARIAFKNRIKQFFTRQK